MPSRETFECERTEHHLRLILRNWGVTPQSFPKAPGSRNGKLKASSYKSYEVRNEGRKSIHGIPVYTLILVK